MKRAFYIFLSLCSGTLFAADDSEIAASDSYQQLFLITPEAKRKESPYSLWANGVALYATQGPLAGISAFRYNSVGGFAGLDYIGMKNLWFGGSVGYLYTMLQESDHAGHQDLQNGYLSVYGYFYFSKFTLDVALTPAYIYTTSYRNVSESGFVGTATGTFPTYEITPHIGMTYTIDCTWGALAPFATCDWTINWVRGFTEKNAGTYNIKQSASVNSLLQTEIGLNVYEYYDLGEKRLLYFRQKLGYLNKDTFEPSLFSGVYVESFSNFTVSVNSTFQNLLTAAAEILYQNGNFSGFVNYDLQCGCGFLMQMVTLNVRQNF